MATKYVDIDKSISIFEDLTINENQNSDSFDSESEEDDKPHITYEEVKNCLGKIRTFLKKMQRIKKRWIIFYL